MALATMYEMGMGAGANSGNTASSDKHLEINRAKVVRHHFCAVYTIFYPISPHGHTKTAIDRMGCHFLSSLATSMIPLALFSTLQIELIDLHCSFKIIFPKFSDIMVAYGVRCKVNPLCSMAPCQLAGASSVGTKVTLQVCSNILNLTYCCHLPELLHCKQSKFHRIAT